MSAKVRTKKKAMPNPSTQPTQLPSTGLLVHTTEMKARDANTPGMLDGMPYLPLTRAGTKQQKQPSLKDVMPESCGITKKASP
ncbi:hypothetical protein WI665_12045 [Vibrio cholerae]